MLLTVPEEEADEQQQHHEHSIITIMPSPSPYHNHEHITTSPPDQAQNGEREGARASEDEVDYHEVVSEPHQHVERPEQASDQAMGCLGCRRELGCWDVSV